MTDCDTMEVRLIGSIWDWVCDMAEKSTERVREWRKVNQERMRELSRKSSAAYRERNKDNLDYIERERETSRRTSARNYAKKRAEMTPEELEEYRKKTRERIAALRKKKKEEALAAQQSKENGPA